MKKNILTATLSLVLFGASALIASSLIYTPSYTYYNSHYTTSYQTNSYTYTTGCTTYEYNPYTRTSTVIGSTCAPTYNHYIEQPRYTTYTYYTQPIVTTYYVAPQVEHYTVPPIYNSYYGNYPYHHTTYTSYQNNSGCYYSQGYQICQ